MNDPLLREVKNDVERAVQPAITGAALLFVLMVRQLVKEWRYQSAWV